jgi:tubulin polyglutamylase TTLL5
MTYKFQNGEKKLVKSILDGHGFKEAHPNSSEFNIIWTGNNLKSYAFRSLQENQKVNHFPRSCELTRKDRLFKNVQRMQKEKVCLFFYLFFFQVIYVFTKKINCFYQTIGF